MNVKTAWILVADNFQDEEYIYPFYRFQELGFEVVTASISGETVTGKYGVPARSQHSTAELLDLPLPDALFLPGGFESPDRLRIDSASLEIVRKCDAANLAIGAICHGPWVMISAGVVSGRKMTGYPSVLTDLRNAGAIVSDAGVVVDRNFVSGDHYRNNGPFMRALIDVIR